jgi:hypothetical protein
MLPAAPILLLRFILRTADAGGVKVVSTPSVALKQAIEGIRFEKA